MHQASFLSRTKFRLYMAVIAEKDTVMFQSRRFTTVPTRDSRDRLERAYNNSQPITQGEKNRGAVVALQGAISDLNRGYMVAAEIDGYFGPRTYQAVELFQRDYGLVPDGMVGKQTLSQLDTLYSPSLVRPPVGISVHIGLDRLDPNHYGGEMYLPSPVNDARAMRDIASALGYDALLLTDQSATSAAFIGFMRSAADKLSAGDSLFITFSGHGGQIPNQGVSDDEADMKDETICLYDRMLRDDEIYLLLSQLREGVRVHIVFDSCHSATAAKDPAFSPEMHLKGYKSMYSKRISDKTVHASPYTGAKMVRDAGTDYLSAEDEDIDFSPVPIAADSLESALDGERPQLIKVSAPPKEFIKTITELFSDLVELMVFGSPKFIDDFGAVYNQNKALYDAVTASIPAKSDVMLNCTTTVLSACEDVQSTPAGQPYSLFTYNVMQAWDNGNFDGSYNQLYKLLLGKARPDATPVMTSMGTGGPLARQHDRPFTY